MVIHEGEGKQMPEPPSGPPPGPGKLAAKAKGIPKWGWAAAAGVFVLVLIMYARKQTANTEEIPVTTDEVAGEGLIYDESNLRGVPLNYEGNMSSPTSSSVGPAGNFPFSAQGITVTGGKGKTEVLPKFGEAFSQVTSLVGYHPEPAEKYQYPTLPGTYTITKPGKKKGKPGKNVTYQVGTPSPPVPTMTGGGATDRIPSEFHMLPV